MGVINSLEQIEYINGVPLVIWCYWAGEPMNKNRQISFYTLVDNIEVPVFLIDRTTIKSVEVPAHPFHPTFPYLSAVHQSDYIRIYLLHHYGGGWHDIKATEVSFKEVWPDFADPTIFLIGRPERENGPAQVFDNEGRWMPDYWPELISVTAWVGRKNTPLSEMMYTEINKLLDENALKLQQHPARHPRERKINSNNFLSKTIARIKNIFTGRKNHYPLPWTVFGNIFHPLNYQFKSHIKKTLPKDKVKNAGVYHR